MKDYRIPKSSVQGMEDADLAWAVIEPLWEEVDFSAGPRKVMEFLSSVTRGQAGLLALDWCQKEVRNGGFEQFFTNSTGMLSEPALDGFRMIGADPYAELLEQALSCFPDGKAPLSRSARQNILRLMTKTERFALLDPIEDRFYRLLDQPETDLEKFRAAYVRNNPEEFFKEN